MNRLLAAVIAAITLGGCYAEGEYLRGSAGGVYVSSEPPPLRYEDPLDCGSSYYIPGAWDWAGGGWDWRSGRCVPYENGYVYVRPYYSGGIYYGPYWGPQSGYRGYYGGSPYTRGYPAPPYGRSYEVRPAPPYRSPGVVPAPAPIYRSPGVVPTPAPMYRSPGNFSPAPAPMYRSPGNFSPAPAPAYRAPAAPGRVYVPPPGR